jgi:threonine synthase
VAGGDDAILDAMREGGRRSGVFGEPAGIASLAGLRAAVEVGVVGRRDTALAVVTGSGLKDVKTAIRAAGEPARLPPDDVALDEWIRRAGDLPAGGRA